MIYLVLAILLTARPAGENSYQPHAPWCLSCHVMDLRTYGRYKRHWDIVNGSITSSLPGNHINSSVNNKPAGTSADGSE